MAVCRALGMDSIIGWLEMVIEPAFDFQGFARGCGAGETEGLIAFDMLAQCRGQVAIRAAGELNGQMAVNAEWSQDIGAQNSPPDLNAEVAAGQFEGAGELGDIPSFSLEPEPRERLFDDQNSIGIAHAGNLLQQALRIGHG